MVKGPKWAMEPVRIEDGRITIRNYGPEDLAAIAEAINDPEGWFGAAVGVDTPAKAVRMLEANLLARENGEGNPMVYLVGDEIAGITRFSRIDPTDRSLEIGGTWVAPKWRKTFVNTEVKRLLLEYCFETLRAGRVELRVDPRNINSQRAVLRIGGRLEGRLRESRINPDGSVRDRYLYSFVRSEWPETRKRFADLRAARAPSFPERVETPSLLLRSYVPGDAPGIFDLVERNRATFEESFPKTTRRLVEREAASDYVLEKLHLWLMRSTFCYGVFLRETGAQIGQLQFLRVDWEAGATEIGYFLDAACRGQGLGREMLAAAADLASRELGFRRLVLRIIPGNEASIRTARAAGFEQEGLHRSEFVTGNGELKDLLYFSRITPRRA